MEDLVPVSRRQAPEKKPALPPPPVLTDPPILGIADQDQNFWLIRSQWIRMNGDELYPLVIDECLEDLKNSSVDVQDDVRQKFDRLCDPDKWPL